MPAGVVPGFGGLHVELSSTALVGLGEGARYLVEYPVRLRRAARVARARAGCWPPISATPSACPASIPTDLQADASRRR